MIGTSLKLRVAWAPPAWPFLCSLTPGQGGGSVLAGKAQGAPVGLVRGARGWWWWAGSAWRARRWRPPACRTRPPQETHTQSWGSCAHLQLPGLASASPLAVDTFVTLPDEEHPGIPGVEVTCSLGGGLLEHSRPPGWFASPSGCPPNRWNFSGRHRAGRAFSALGPLSLSTAVPSKAAQPPIRASLPPDACRTARPHHGRGAVREDFVGGGRWGAELQSR